MAFFIRNLNLRITNYFFGLEFAVVVYPSAFGWRDTKNKVYNTGSLRQ